jgi:hypothetical protein
MPTVPDPDLVPFEPPVHPTIRAAFRNVIESYPRALYDGQGLVRYRTWFLDSVFVSEPELIHDILVARAHLFRRDDVARQLLSPMLGPGKINMATAGSGSMLHVYGELFKMMAGVDMVPVPYRVAPPAVTDLIGGQVQVVFDTFAASIEFVRAGKLRALAVTTATRSPALPDVPSLNDFLPGYDASTWLGIGAPKNTPPDIVEKLNKEINAVLARSLDGSADCKLWLHCKFVRRVRQVHRRGHSEMGQGGEVRGHQAGLIRGHSRI